MSNKTYWLIGMVFFIILAIPVGYIYLLNNGNPYTKYLVEKNVPVYLEQQGYSTEEIMEARYVEPKYLINRNFHHGHYMVKFVDEPDTTYYYGIMKKGTDVVQFCEKDLLTGGGVTHTITITETIHSEENCVYSLENR
ncbi:DUF3139 domain-containing protein [Evansella tamaricis]|uniref:DUF3139 domain-containing protein n=1 Tax=Evansella tamaricis TaxID=2069301 RepID=A0ABS6JML3_9BACI|nr:DUF3139 domain-containing protein [Evansella tamaricis]MBU9714916.1 DUF3139 domain-containing protein [Evansella tamaricis]